MDTTAQDGGTRRRGQGEAKAARVVGQANATKWGRGFVSDKGGTIPSPYLLNGRMVWRVRGRAGPARMICIDTVTTLNVELAEAAEKIAEASSHLPLDWII